MLTNRRRRLSILTLSFVLPLIASRTREATAEEKWTRQVSVSGPNLPVAVGAPFNVSISDRLVGPTTCDRQSSGCGGGGCSTPTKPNPSQVEDLACTGAPDCTATVASTPRVGEDISSKSLAVEASGEGTATYSFRLRDLSGDVRDVSFTVVFLKPTKIEVARLLEESPHGTKYAALPNAKYTWCARLVREKEDLLFELDQITLSGVTELPRPGGGGARLARTSHITGFPACATFSVGKAGTRKVKLAYGTSLVRTETIQVMPSYRAVSIDVIKLPAPALSSTDGHMPTPIEIDPLADAKALARVNADSCTTGERKDRFLPMVRMDDGSVALGAIGLSVDPKELASVDHVHDDQDNIAEPFTISTRSTTGRGMIHITVGSIDFALPLTVSGRCGSPLQPTTDANDADDAGGAGDGGTGDAGFDASAPVAADGGAAPDGG